MLIKRLLHLPGVNVVSAGNDDVFFPVGDVEKSFLIHISHISGKQPAVSDDTRRLLLLIPVSFHDLRAAHDQLAVFIRPRKPAFFF